ncbi:hypothetical protein STVIR_7321 [Streptomyces viridochromogenes Tue57]|uniref:Uncharacterized protein n=1 Tax=Streptomyces viridochromogenes Tue57 TaxID=1160705 RepID=L8P5T7_STRVR|nr:hypothetical protein STVIR_7321 [Streptomyces viridochromogenes Tue57]
MGVLAWKEDRGTGRATGAQEPELVPVTVEPPGDRWCALAWHGPSWRWI